MLFSQKVDRFGLKKWIVLAQFFLKHGLLRVQRLVAHSKHVERSAQVLRTRSICPFLSKPLVRRITRLDVFDSKSKKVD